MAQGPDIQTVHIYSHRQSYLLRVHIALHIHAPVGNNFDRIRGSVEEVIKIDRESGVAFRPESAVD